MFAAKDGFRDSHRATGSRLAVRASLLGYGCLDVPVSTRVVSHLHSGKVSAPFALNRQAGFLTMINAMVQWSIDPANGCGQPAALDKAVRRSSIPPLVRLF